MHHSLPCPALLLAVALTLFPCLLSAQAKKGFDLIGKKKYGEAVAAFRRDLGSSDPEAAISAHYGLSLAYAEIGFAGHQSDSALYHITSAQVAYKKADRKLKDKLTKKKRGYAQMSAHQKKVEDLVLLAAIQSRSSERIEEALKRCKGAPAKTRSVAKQTMEALVKERLEQSALRSSRDLALILAYLKKYPKPSHPDSLDQKMAPLLLERGSICDFEGELEGHPFNLCLFPKTAQVLLQLYQAQADGMAMQNFGNRYGGCFGKELDLELGIALEADSAALVFEAQPGRSSALLRLAAPRPVAFKAAQRLLKGHLMDKNWQAALDSLRTWQPFFGDKSPEFSQLLRLMQAASEGLRPASLGDSINTGIHEIAPVMSADGRTLYFCRNDPDSYNEDLFFAKKTARGWTQAQPLASFDVTDQNHAPLSLTADGTGMFFFQSGDVFYVEKTEQGWQAELSQPVSFSTPDNWEGMVTISPDKKVLLFEAIRLNNVGTCLKTDLLGGRRVSPDLFLCFRQADGAWGTPINLGTAINTPFSDRAPFLHPDGRTLYFSSEGHGSLGGLDVYKTTRLDSTWLHWSQPLNLGREINTPADDWGYQVSLDGRQAFFSSDHDLFQVELPKSGRPDSVSTIVLRLVDLANKPFSEGKVVVRTLDTRKVIGEFSPDPQTKEVFITAPAGQPVIVEVQVEGAPPVSVNMGQGAGGSEQVETIQVPIIAKMKANEEVTVELKNLFFGVDSFNIESRSEVELQNWAAFISEQGLRVEIAGHTDDAGSEAYNRTLSQRRADATKQRLIELGCEPEDISAVGYGESRPVCPGNATPECQAKNRRVEVRFSKK